MTLSTYTQMGVGSHRKMIPVPAIDSAVGAHQIHVDGAIGARETQDHPMRLLPSSPSTQTMAEIWVRVLPRRRAQIHAISFRDSVPSCLPPSPALRGYGAHAVVNSLSFGIGSAHRRQKT